jgi:hypothetical protein
MEDLILPLVIFARKLTRDLKFIGWVVRKCGDTHEVSVKCLAPLLRAGFGNLFQSFCHQL